jgi:hypothetical protein
VKRWSSRSEETTIHASPRDDIRYEHAGARNDASVDTVFINPVECSITARMLRYIALKLSEILGVSYESIMAKWEDTKSWYKNSRRENREGSSRSGQGAENEYDLKSVHIMEDTKRTSMQQPCFPGYRLCRNGQHRAVRTENYYERYLRGINGRIVRCDHIRRYRYAVYQI